MADKTLIILIICVCFSLGREVKPHRQSKTSQKVSLSNTSQKDSFETKCEEYMNVKRRAELEKQTAGENNATETNPQEPTKQTADAQEQTKEVKHEANVTTEDSHKNATVSEEFVRSKLIPDLVLTSPQNILDVVYESDKEVQMGNELTPKLVINPPTVKFDAEYGSYYTLIMTDPDAPSRKDHRAREWNHWLVVNIPGNNISQGDTLSEYVGSAPPKGTGLHRYVFLLFKQPEKLQFHETIHSNTDGNRGKFNTEKFSRKYNMGAPIAGNYFQAKWDDSVPALHKQLGF